MIKNVLRLWYAAQSPKTPGWAKTIAYGALGYFVLPADAIVDLTPFIGFTDDVGVIGVALVTIAAHIDGEICTQADETLARWFNKHPELPSSA